MNEELPDERLLEDCLGDYWRGAFTLRDTPDGASDGPAGAGPETTPGASPAVAPGTALAALGPSGVSVRGRDLAALLEPAYRAFTA